jgi:predicted ATPase
MPAAVPLLGRTAELGRLLAAAERAADGAGSAVLLVGEPGIGKSRLAVEALHAAAGRGFVCLSGVAYPLQGGLAYAPVLDAVGPYLSELDPARQARLVGGLPDLGRLFGELRLPAPEPLGDPALERTRLFEAVARLLDRIAAETPLAVLVDDLHWADTASLELLHYLGRGLAGRPILLLGTYREAEARTRPELLALVRSLERLELGERLEIGGLERDAVAALAAAVLGGEPPPSLTDLLHARAGGTPLFVTALIRALAEAGALTRGGHGWALTGEIPARVPPVVRDLVLGRLEHLGAGSGHCSS